jgi:hypothetical protein
MYSINFFFPIGCPGVGGCPSPGACWAYPRAGPDPYHPTKNRDGVIQMGLAENQVWWTIS